MYTLTYISVCYVTREWLRYLPNLTALDIWGRSTMVDSDLKHFPQLTSLSITGTSKITDEGIKYVPNLTYLDVCGLGRITYRSLQHLPNLKQLHLSNFNFQRRDNEFHILWEKGVDIRKAKYNSNTNGWDFFDFIHNK